ncbi:hypothetical protein [Pseudomonas gingeri]|uniref:hypothetical protein n=1 Tax=Pseudomonas gingeri TaxID=117681 RepID=UPI0021556080|nr:hypothetical protein [Pseudomonas gingeri]
MGVQAGQGILQGGFDRFGDGLADIAALSSFFWIILLRLVYGFGGSEPFFQLGITLPDFFAEGFILGIHSFDSVCVIGDPFVMAHDATGVGLMGCGVVGDPVVMARDIAGVGLMGAGVIGDPFVMVRDATGVGLMGGGVVGDPVVMACDVAGVGLMGAGVIGDPVVMVRDATGVGLMGGGVVGDPVVMARDVAGVGLMGGGVVGDPVVMARDATGVGLMGGGVVGDPFVMVRDVAGVGLMGGGVVSDPFVMACDAVGAGLDSSRIGRDIAQIGFDNTDVRGDRLGRRRPLRERWLRSGGNRSFPPRTALCGRSEVPGIRVDRPAEYWRWLADL